MHSLSIFVPTHSYIRTYIELSHTHTRTLSAWAGTGQPNYYIARRRRPTLADYDFRDVSAGATATIRTSLIYQGVYVIGVQAYCCVGATSLATLITSGPTNCGNGQIDSGVSCCSCQG